MDADEYLRDPCGASSLPFWKARRVVILADLTILRDDMFRQGEYPGHDEPYFRLLHDLRQIPSFRLPLGFETVECGAADFAGHINACYDREHISADELKAYAAHPVYDPSLWIAVAEKGSRQVVATGIAELDADISEGIIEWIQVSPSFRRRGLGAYVVCELLRRMRGKARFATVSGRLNNAAHPYALYCACGFSHPVIWHVLSSR